MAVALLIDLYGFLAALPMIALRGRMVRAVAAWRSRAVNVIDEQPAPANASTVTPLAAAVYAMILIGFFFLLLCPSFEPSDLSSHAEISILNDSGEKWFLSGNLIYADEKENTFAIEIAPKVVDGGYVSPVVWPSFVEEDGVRFDPVRAEMVFVTPDGEKKLMVERTWPGPNGTIDLSLRCLLGAPPSPPAE